MGPGKEEIRYVRAKSFMENTRLVGFCVHTNSGRGPVVVSIIVAQGMVSSITVHV